jgi:hypothetical protein
MLVWMNRALGASSRLAHNFVYPICNDFAGVHICPIPIASLLCHHGKPSFKLPSATSSCSYNGVRKSGFWRILVSLTHQPR